MTRLLFAYLFCAAAQAIPLQVLLQDQTVPREIVYKEELKLYVFAARDAKPAEQRPAVVWIHGGGWRGGNPAMFFPHARYYSQRGAVGISVQYRLGNVADCVADVKAAVQYIRTHSGELGVDPNRIAAMGDSAGGHLAIELGAEVNAVAAYNPVTDLTGDPWRKLLASDEEARALSPLMQIKRGLAPMLVLHGTADTVVAAEQSRQFCAAMKAVGNRCDLSLYDAARHAFVIAGYTAPEATVVRAIREGDSFLVSLGFLKGAPSLLVSPPNEVYVAIGGRDSNAGTRASPLATLERALEKKPSAIVLRAGSYPRTAPLVLRAKDSGVTIRAESGEAVKLVAGIAVPRSAIKLSASDRLDPVARGKVYEIEAASLGVKHLKRFPEVFSNGGGIVDLYFDGVRLQLARWPNRGYANMVKVTDNGDWSNKPTRHGGTFVYAGDRPARWLKAVEEGLWLDGFWRVPWAPEKVRVAKIDTAAKTITHAQPVNLGIGSKYKRPEGDGIEPWYALNVLEEIDQPGEWSLDFKTGRIYVWPPSAEGSLIIADMDAPVVSLEGTSNVRIERLAFEGGLGNAIEVKGGNDNLIAGCIVRNFGRTAVVINGGAGHTVLSCDLHHMGEGGVFVSGGDRKTLTPSGHRIVNNHMWRLGEVKKTYAPAVDVSFDKPSAVGVTIANNLIHDLPHAAVLYSGNDHLFERNEVHNVALDSGDVGAFYATNDWTSRGTVLRHNFVHHSTGANAFYMDDGNSGDMVVGNIIYRTAYGPFISGGHDNTVRGNVVIEANRGLHMDARGIPRHYDKTDRHKMQLLESVDYQQPPWSTRYPALLHIFDKPEYPTGNLMEGNALVDCKEPYHLEKGDNLRFSTVRDNVVTSMKEAGLMNPATLDFRPLPDSKLLPILKEIPFDRIGLYRDAYRSTLPTAAETGRNSDRRAETAFDSDKDRKASDAKR